MLTNKFYFLNVFSMLNSFTQYKSWGNRPFVFLSGGAGEGAQWGKCPTTPWY
jgi:hypothetical protein